MTDNPEDVKTCDPQPTLRKEIAQYGRPIRRKAVWQLINTFAPYLGLWVLLILAVQRGYSYWVTLALTVPASALLVRIFILFHDCCHGSFFASRRANTFWGYVTGILCFTPYEDWQRSHFVHHATAGDLDRRGVGDVWTMTVDEYLAAPKRQRLAYRLARNPFVVFGLGPLYIFVVAQRLWRKGAEKRERVGVLSTNAALAVIIIGATYTIGFKTYVLIQLPIVLMGGAAGLWLFYVQHQFESTYWARHETYSALQAALQGSSYYRLPKVLQWFTGNIGLHHIHHINARIPNYRLQECYDNTPAMQAVQPMTLRASLKSVSTNLWDEQQQKLVSFGSLRSASR